MVVDLRLGHAVEALGAPAAVADGRARKVREAAALVDLVHQHRKVRARVRLARDVKGTGHERREALEEGDEGLVGVLRGGLVGVDALAFARAVREANALGLLDGKERAHLGPPELIVVQRRRGGWRGGLGRRIARGGHRLELAELGEHADHAARTRAAVDPHDHRIGGWVALGLLQPVMEHARRTGGVADRQVATVMLARERAGPAGQEGNLITRGLRCDRQRQQPDGQHT